MYDEQRNTDMFDNANPDDVQSDNVYDDNVYDDNVYDDNVYDGNVYDDNVYDEQRSVDCHNVSDNEWVADLKVNGQSVLLEVDTGARCNIMSLNTVKRLGLECDIQKSNVRINGVHGNVIQAYGVLTTKCTYKGETCDIIFQVMNGKKDLDLLGRADIARLGPVIRVNAAETKMLCQTIMNKYQDVLGSSIGCMPGEYEIKIDDTVTLVVHPPRSVPAALRQKVKDELDHLEKCGIIAKISKPTQWVNSMVVVRKKNGKVRICIDPCDLNEAILREHHPMNSIEDIVTRLQDSAVYSVLDANSGYFQIKLTERSSELTTFNTPFGRYRYLRLPMGIRCAAEVFQRQMSTALSDIEGVEIVVDDILVHGRNQKEHDERLIKVLERARKLNLKLNSEKSQISKTEVEYVGHKITPEGLKLTDEQIRAISNMKVPENIQDLETVLGMVAYVAKFIPRLSDLCEPLRAMKKAEEWDWGPAQQDALSKIKETLTSDTVLRYYDVGKPITLTVDASMKGLGAALIQSNGVVAYASRALTPTEQKYAQIEKEALAVVFGCTKFHKMLYGKSDVTVETDHKPLEAIWKKTHPRSTHENTTNATQATTLRVQDHPHQRKVYRTSRLFEQTTSWRRRCATGG